MIQGEDERHTAVREYLGLIKPDLVVDLHKLQDPFGPSIVQPDLEGVCAGVCACVCACVCVLVCVCLCVLVL